MKKDTTAELTLHHFSLSPFGDKIIRVLNYKALGFELLEYPPASKGVKKFSPTGKLPCLKIGEQWVNDSTDIAHELERLFPEPSLIPESPVERAQVHVLEDWADESLYFYEMHLRFALPENSSANVTRMIAKNRGLTKWFLHKMVPRAIHSITKTQGVGRKSERQLKIDLQRHVSAIEDLLTEADWLVGDRLTLADISVYAMMNCIKDSQQGVECLQGYDRVNDWMQRVERLTETKAS